MRLLVISDSHKRASVADEIIRREKDASHIFFLGDNVCDVEDLQYEFTDKKFHIVCGNCDYFSEYPAVDIAVLGGINILFTHGHTMDVKYDLTRISLAAKNAGCSIALYGHTHIPNIKYEDGLYLVNPGSCAKSRDGANTYAVIDIVDGAVMPIIKKV